MSLLAAAAGLALAAGASAMGMAGCGGADLKLCGQIPEDGCPLGRGGSCEDRTCAALYDCVDGLWTLVRECDVLGPGGSGGAGGEGGQGGSGGSGGECVGAVLDHTGERAGCEPELQDPDCPATVAESCGACMTGCVDFFMCFEDGWHVVAYCSDEGELIVGSW